MTNLANCDAPGAPPAGWGFDAFLQPTTFSCTPNIVLDAAGVAKISVGPIAQLVGAAQQDVACRPSATLSSEPPLALIEGIFRALRPTLVDQALRTTHVAQALSTNHVAQALRTLRVESVRLPPSLFQCDIAADKPLLTGIGWPGILERLAAVADAEQFPPAVLSMARAAVNIIGRTVYLLPTLSDGSDDDLSLFWRYHDVEASLSFERDGAVVGYAYRAGSKGPWVYEGTSINAAGLQPLISVLTAI